MGNDDPGGNTPKQANQGLQETGLLIIIYSHIQSNK